MISKEDILNKTENGLSVFRFYINGNWKVGKHYRNPFYDDKKHHAVFTLTNIQGLIK